MSAACEAVLKKGSRADRETKIQNLIQEVEEARYSFLHLPTEFSKAAFQLGLIDAALGIPKPYFDSFVFRIYLLDTKYAT